MSWFDIHVNKQMDSLMITVTILTALSLQLLVVIPRVGVAAQLSNLAAESVTPVFVEQPNLLYYVVKGKPVTIRCKAMPAMQLNLKCVDQWVPPEQHHNKAGLDSEANVRYLETSIQVSKEQLEEPHGSEAYWCECHAWNSSPGDSHPLTAKSRRGIVQAAYLRKRFEREPISSVVEIQSSTQLQCLPPPGLPSPEVFWMKDGEVLDVKKDINFIISNEGSLIINQAHLSNSGNYTCGAQNLASRRLSESALLTVYINGGWTLWSPWSECGSKCGKGFQRRIRSCSNPTPLNGGAPCSGDAVQRLPCSNICPDKVVTHDRQQSNPVDGVWSTWSSWSTCSTDCKHHRRRICNDPAPNDGGLGCEGNDLDTDNCTGGLCKDASGYISSQISDKTRDTGYVYSLSADRTISYRVPDDNVAMYVGLIVAIGFLILVVIVIIVLLRCRQAKPSAAVVKKLVPPCNGFLLHPDVAKRVPPSTNTTMSSGGVARNYSHPLAKSTNSSDQAYNAMFLNEHPYCQLLNPAEQSPRKAESDNDSQPWSTSSEGDTSQHSTVSCQISGDVDTESLVYSTFTSSGGRLIISSLGVSLTIPEGAIPAGCTSEIYISVTHNSNDHPKLTDVQTLLSPVIVCGPDDLLLKKPVILSFPHCASIKHGQWALQVYGGEIQPDDSVHWQMLSCLGQETINTPVYVQVEQSQCHVMLENLMRYALVGEPIADGRTIKLLRLCVFAPAVGSSLDFSLRVYCIDDTDDAFQRVLAAEDALNGRLIDVPKTFLFQHGAAGLCISIEELHPAWRCKMAATCQEIPFCHIWNGIQSDLHCSFMLEHLDQSSGLLTCSIRVFQRSLLANQQLLQLSCDLNHSLLTSPLHRLKKPQSSKINQNGVVSVQSTQSVFRLPAIVRKKLCDILDPPNSRGNDWRMFAQRLSVDRYINYFATKPSPTETILDLWEARHREQSAVTDLMNSLRVMGRMDAAAVLEKEMNLTSWI